MHKIIFRGGGASPLLAHACGRPYLRWAMDHGESGSKFQAVGLATENSSPPWDSITTRWAAL